MLSEPDTWGGVIYCSPLDTYRYYLQVQQVESLGFTILGVESYAGHAILLVWGFGPAVTSITQDQDVIKDLQPHFFRVPVGEELNVGTILKWANHRSEVIFQ